MVKAHCKKFNGIFNSLAKEYHVDAVAESAGFDTEDGLPASENAIKACSEIT